VIISEYLIPITLFLAVAAVIIMHIVSRHRERITMIEKGLSSEDIKALYAREQKNRANPMGVLKWGILFIFVGAAVLLGTLLGVWYHLDDGIMVGLITLFGGMGLVLFYGIAAKKKD
jgi:hypothetical protein